MSDHLLELLDEIRAEFEPLLGSVDVVPVSVGEEDDFYDFAGKCDRCGRYWDARLHVRCPDPCGGHLR